MHGIYMTDHNMDDQTSGVTKKIMTQIKSFEDNGMKMELRYKEKDTKLGLIKYRIRKLCPFASNSFSVQILHQINSLKLTNVDFIYYRYTYIDKALIKAFKQIKKVNPRLKILFEIPTFPYDKEFDSWYLKPNLYKDKKFRLKLKDVVDRIVTFSDDLKIYDVGTIKISNTVDFDKIKKRTPKKGDGTIRVIAVALFSFFHGYDRFIEGLRNYYSAGGDRKIELYLVGEGKILEHYRSLVTQYDLTEHVVFKGKLFGEELDEVYDKCELGIDSLGRHRSGIFYNSSLKGKEYIAKGLPIISGVRTEFDELKFPYYHRVPSDDTPVDINEILEFYDEIYGSNIPREAIIAEIRAYAMNNFHPQKTFEPIIKFLQTTDGIY